MLTRIVRCDRRSGTRRSTRSRGGRAGARRRASAGGRAPSGRGARASPSSRSIARRAAIPIDLTIWPRAPIRIRFCDSVSARITASTRIELARRGPSRSTRPQPRPRAAPPRGCAPAPARARARPSDRRLGLVRALLGLEVERSRREQRDQVVDQRPHPDPVCAPRRGTPRLGLDRRGRDPPRLERGGRPALGSTRSILLTAITTGRGRARSSPAMNRSPGPTPCSALITNRQPSASSSSCSTRRCIRSVSASRGRWTPGRSTSTSCQPGPLATPRIARRVVCGLSETIATFAPTTALASVDLPTLGRPASAMKPERVGAAHRAQRSNSAWSASISPSSVS